MADNTLPFTPWHDTLVVGLGIAVPFLLIIGRVPAEIAMHAISLLFLIHCIRHQDWGWLKAPWVRMSMIIGAYLFISAAFAAVDRGSALGRAAGWLRFPLFSAASMFWLWPKAQGKIWPRYALMAGLGAVAIDTIIQFIFGTSLSGFAKPNYPGRLSGPFDQELVVGVYMARLAWPIIGLAFASAWLWPDAATKYRKRFALPVLYTGLIGMAIFLSGERVVTALFGLCALLFFFGARGLRGLLGTCGLIAATAIIGMVMTVPVLHNRFITHTQHIIDHDGSSVYTNIWLNALQAWQMAPVTGVGPKNFRAVCIAAGESGGFKSANMSPEPFACATHPHNLYLEWLSETGVIGLLLFLGLIGVWAHSLWQSLRQETEIVHYYQKLGFTLGLVPALWPLMSSMSFFSNWSAILFWWVLGLSLSSIYRKSNLIA